MYGGGGPGFGGGGPGYGGPGPMAPAIIVQQQPPYQEPPKYAYFDRGNDDALPIMPSLEKSQRIEVTAKEEHEMAYMGRGNGQQQQEYGYVQPAGGVRYPSNGLQHPPPVRGYAQDGYNEQYQDPYSGRSGDARYQQETGVTHHGGNMYQESPGYHQEQQQWNGHPQNGGNNYGAGDHKTDPYQYQGSTQHQNPDYSSQRKQEAWTAV
ncbi:hypothetical protein Q9L58_000776 [Maublancomyces gigas]|uniref:Bindin n=1 Tax=Discina gigas TaxID=1032678 RepID=A0ABR3GWG8_9PEZI